MDWSWYRGAYQWTGLGIEGGYQWTGLGIEGDINGLVLVSRVCISELFYVPVGYQWTGLDIEGGYQWTGLGIEGGYQ